MLQKDFVEHDLLGYRVPNGMCRQRQNCRVSERRIRQTLGEVFWTPRTDCHGPKHRVHDWSKEQADADVAWLNVQAKAIMEKYGVPTVDLYAQASNRQEDLLPLKVGPGS